MAELFSRILTASGARPRAIFAQGSTVRFRISKVLKQLNGSYHLIIPSLPGYAFSSAPPLDKEFGMEEVGKCYGELMKGLGFTSYIAQGSDVGGKVIDYISTLFDECKSEFFTPFSPTKRANKSESRY